MVIIQVFIYQNRGDLRWDINSTGINGAQLPIYTLDVNSVGEFDFKNIGDRSVRLQNYSDAAFFEKSLFEKWVKAYYLNSRTDNTVTINIMRHADFFFTDTITGCSFLAEGLKSQRCCLFSFQQLCR